LAGNNAAIIYPKRSHSGKQPRAPLNRKIEDYTEIQLLNNLKFYNKSHKFKLDSEIYNV